MAATTTSHDETTAPKANDSERPSQLSFKSSIIPTEMPPRFSDSPNARSKSITTTELDTFGVLNRHATKNPSYQVGISEDKGTRRTMEDAHSFVTDFDNVRGQGFFAIFDGHAGKHAAEWCGSHFHEFLLHGIHTTPTMHIPDLLNMTFHAVDESLSQMCEESDGKIHSGCTAVTAFLRVEDPDGNQSFLQSSPIAESPISASVSSAGLDDHASPHESSAESGNVSGEDNTQKKKQKKEKRTSQNRLKQALKSLSSGSMSLTAKKSDPVSPPAITPSKTSASDVSKFQIHMPPTNSKRVLYCANAGDARGVLCRAGKSVRLTYDHKGSDKQEAKRITDAGGFVMSGRVNGVLAVTRSLGDSSMKEFVVGAPYTTETELCDDDEFLILACDGLWDVINDQAACDLIHEVEDAQHASQKLLKYALSHHTTDNVTVLVVRFKHTIPQTA